MTKTSVSSTIGGTSEPQRPTVAVGAVPFFFALLSALLLLIPDARPAAGGLLLVLLIPAGIAWLRARKLTDGSRGVTSTTVAMCLGGFFLAVVMSPAEVPAPVISQPVSQPLVIQSSVPQPVVHQPLMPQPTAPIAEVPAVSQPQVHTQVPRSVPRPLVATHRAAPAPAEVPVEEPAKSSAYYKNCTAAKAAGAAPLSQGDPGYRAALDRDSDGIACE